MNTNLGLKIAEAFGGEVETTWYSQDGLTVSHGKFNPFVPLYDDGGTEIKGALQKRMGMPVNLTDFQPGYGTHADALTQFPRIAQKAIDAGWFTAQGIDIPPGTQVNGQTILSGLNRLALTDFMYIFTAARANSEIVKKFQDPLSIVVDPHPLLPATLDAFFLKKGKQRPERITPLAWAHADMLAAGVDITTPAGLDKFYTYIAARLTKDIRDGKVSSAAEPADTAGYSFVTLPISVFMRWQAVVSEKSLTT